MGDKNNTGETDGENAEPLAEKLLSDSSTLPSRRSLKREVSNMSDAEVATSAIRLTKRRVRGKQTMPEAFAIVAPTPVCIPLSFVFVSLSYYSSYA